MSSEKPRRKNEEELYETIMNELETVFSVDYIEKEKKYQTAPRSPFDKRNPYLEITAEGKFSDTLKAEFNKDSLSILNVERLTPDIMGFVQKKPSSKKELITVEVKDKPLRIVDVAKAKLYQDVFNATFSLLISTKGIPEEKLRFVLDNYAIRGKVIIMRYVQQFFNKERGMSVGYFVIDQRFQDSVQEPFKRFCK